MSGPARLTARRALFFAVQCLWGAPQTLLGLAVFLRQRRRPHRWYRGAVVTLWPHSGCVSLGAFLFVTAGAEKTPLLVHEYGHGVQSLVLGPLYLPLVALPSALWYWLPPCRSLRRRGVSYYAFYTERWANRWGRAATGCPAPEA